MALNRLTRKNFVQYEGPKFPVYDYWYNVLVDRLNTLTGEEGALSDGVKLGEAVGDEKSPAFLTAKTLYYTVGVPGVTGCDYNFVSAANTTEQSIQLGGEAIIPARSRVLDVVVACVASVAGGTATVDAGNVSGGNQYISAGNCDADTEIVGATAAGYPYATLSLAASSVYFSATPSANWSGITVGKWAIYVTYLDYSVVS